MFKRDANAQFVYKNVRLGLFKMRRLLCFQSGTWQSTIDEASHQLILAAQKDKPIPIARAGELRKRWWMFLDEFYWEDEDLSEGDVKVLVLDRLMQRRKKVQRATVRLSASAGSRTNREGIPDDIKVLVWQRDEGRCSRCAFHSS